MRAPWGVAVAALLITGCDQLVTTPLRYGTVEVSVTRRNGDKLANVPMHLFTGQRIMAYGKTDSTGIMRFERVPEGPAYAVRVERASGFEFIENLLGGTVNDAVIGMKVRRDSISTVRFTLLKIGPGTIEAQVTEPGGAPVAGVKLELYRPSGVIREGVAGTNGRLSFDAVPFGQYGVRAYRPKAYRDLDEPLTVWTDGVVVEGGVTAVAPLSMAPCRGTIDVRVTDPVYGAASGVRLLLFTVEGVVDSVRTAADGSARFTTPFCSDFGVRAIANGDWRFASARGSEFVDGLVIRRGTVRSAALSAQYNTCRGNLRVSVTDGTGAFIPGARLELYTAANADTLRTMVTAAEPAIFSNLGCGPPERGVRIVPPAGWKVTEGAGTSWVDALVIRAGATLDVAFRLSR
ncbi:MAG: carboxypeptidase regulatory-like domain-containing protein [Gemmatimonadetes bacterium]|nr:carboxypeptidase regulatory-like domain-containing protein [Gemmatimonadota bacterium]